MRHTASVPLVSLFSLFFHGPFADVTRKPPPHLDGQATQNRRTKSQVMQVIVLLTALPKVIAENIYPGRLTRIECRYSAVHSCVRYPRKSINQRPRGPLSRHVRRVDILHCLPGISSCICGSRKNCCRSDVSGADALRNKR